MDGVFENVTKRHGGGWVGKLKRHVTLVFFVNNGFQRNFIMSKMIFQMSPMILFASILTIVMNKLRYKK